MYDSMRLTYEEVKSKFEAEGCELLETEYKNARTKMRYRCSCGNESSIVYDSFRKGNRCRQCGNKKSRYKQKLRHEEVSAYFKEQGCELLEEYKDSRTPVSYRCNCGNIAKISWNNFRTKNKRCRECGIAKRSGSNHYEWKEDREAHNAEYAFRQRSYKLIKMVLNVTGRVKNERTAKLLGYDYKALQEHITGHPNWSSVKDRPWHIDHIFPIKAFLDFGISDLKIVNALDNLRPLEATENLAKNAKYDKEAFKNYLRHKGVSFTED